MTRYTFFQTRAITSKSQLFKDLFYNFSLIMVFGSGFLAKVLVKMRAKIFKHNPINNFTAIYVNFSFNRSYEDLNKYFLQNRVALRNRYFGIILFFCILRDIYMCELNIMILMIMLVRKRQP